MPLRAPDEPRSYLQARPPGNDRVGVDAVHDDELLTARGTGDDLQVTPRDAELIAEDPEESCVGRAVDRGSHDPDLEHTIDHAIDALDR